MAEFTKIERLSYIYEIWEPFSILMNLIVMLGEGEYASR